MKMMVSVMLLMVPQCCDKISTNRSFPLDSSPLSAATPITITSPPAQDSRAPGLYHYAITGPAVSDAYEH